MKTLAQYDFSKIRYVTNTAAALPVKHITMLSDLFPHAAIYSMYGLTNASAAPICRPSTSRTSRPAWASPFPTPSCGSWARTTASSDPTRSVSW